MLIDMHAHTSGISTCCLCDADGIIARTQRAGLDGIILTNHYQELYVNDGGGDADAFAARYVREYEHTKRVGEARGCRVLFGVELTMKALGGTHVLVYGVKTDFVLAHPTLHLWSQETLYREVSAVGGAVVQAHPLRNGGRLLDLGLLHGIEISCHPLYHHSYRETLIPTARDAHLALTVGGDFHNDAQYYRPRCGVYLDDATTTEDVGSYLRTATKQSLFIHEPHEDAPFLYEYTRELL